MLKDTFVGRVVVDCPVWNESKRMTLPLGPKSKNASNTSNAHGMIALEIATYDNPEHLWVRIPSVFFARKDSPMHIFYWNIRNSLPHFFVIGPIAYLVHLFYGSCISVALSLSCLLEVPWLVICVLESAMIENRSISIFAKMHNLFFYAQIDTYHYVIEKSKQYNIGTPNEYCNNFCEMSITRLSFSRNSKPSSIAFWHRSRSILAPWPVSSTLAWPWRLWSTFSCRPHRSRWIVDSEKNQSIRYGHNMKIPKKDIREILNVYVTKAFSTSEYNKFFTTRKSPPIYAYHQNPTQSEKKNLT